MELAESTWHFGVTNSTTCVTVLQVEKSPVVIKTGVSKGDAEAMKKQLEAGGQDRVVLLCGWRWVFFGPGAGSRDCCAFVCLLSSSRQGVFVITWNDKRSCRMSSSVMQRKQLEAMGPRTGYSNQVVRCVMQIIGCVMQHDEVCNAGNAWLCSGMFRCVLSA